jgi:putative transposase
VRPLKSTLVSSKKHTGYDGGKKIKGSKRTLAVDTSGRLLAVAVHSAGVADRKAGTLLTERLKADWPCIARLFADGGYSLVGRSSEEGQTLDGYPLEVVKRSELSTFQVLPKRWVVERSFAWIETNRRNAKSFERLPVTAEAIVQLSFIRLMLNRLNN